MDKEIVERARKAIFGVLNCWDVNEDAQREIISTAILPEVKQARAEVLAACVHATCVLCRTGEKPHLQSFGGKNWEGRYQGWVHDVKIEGRVEVQTCPADAIHSLQPAAADLEALTDRAHEAGAVIAGEQLLKSLTEGGDFAVGSPLDKAKKRVEALLREAQLEVVKTSPECWHYNTETEREFIDRYFAWRGRRIERLEKARAILEADK